MREKLIDLDIPSPKYSHFNLDEDPDSIAESIDYPCVLKPINLSASQGVIRANNAKEFIVAFRRIKELLLKIEKAKQGKIVSKILVEDYIEGEEIVLEGLMVSGKLTTLTIFDKPDPLNGPFFEETIYVTPSRKSRADQDSIKNLTEQAANSIGLLNGPIHSEIRLQKPSKDKNTVPWIIEIAARSIGGLCSRSLLFNNGLSLEDIIIRHALGKLVLPERETAASGVMMIPIPKSGVLNNVNGILEARAVENISDLTITIPRGAEVIPIPEGHKYLGFIFAKATTSEKVEHALRLAHSKLTFDIH